MSVALMPFSRRLRAMAEIGDLVRSKGNPCAHALP